MDCSVVNFTPFTYVETKPGCVPNSFTIPPATGENEEIPGILHVGNIHSNLYMALQEHTYAVPVPGDSLAEDLVISLISAKLCYDKDIAEPALFWVEGHHSAYVINKDFKDRVSLAMKKQRVWLEKLVRLADDDWQKYRQHKFITEVQRWAAKKLGQKKEWSAIPASVPIETMNCPYCGNLSLKGVAICPNCKQILDHEMFRTIQATLEGKTETPKLEAAIKAK